MAPSDAITVAAWVTLDSPTEHQWGGIVSFVQDNGGYEKGFVLGYTSDGKFTWGVSDGSLNYLKATTAAAQAGVLHYVVGTYDSTTQNLYVDGELVATSEALSGAIEYAGTETLAFGCYLDDNEEFQMTGTIDSVKIFDSALTAQQARGGGSSGGSSDALFVAGPSGGDYDDAVAYCSSIGASIATIYSATENELARAACGESSCWIGLEEVGGSASTPMH